jgi:hypothetical protein
MPGAGVEGYMRPGCVHVTLQATVAASAVASDGGAHNLRNAIAHLLEREPPAHCLLFAGRVAMYLTRVAANTASLLVTSALSTRARSAAQAEAEFLVATQATLAPGPAACCWCSCWGRRRWCGATG